MQKSGIGNGKEQFLLYSVAVQFLRVLPIKINIPMKKLLLTLALTLFPVCLFSTRSISQTRTPATSTSKLVSPETGVDYSRLRDLLAAGNWKKANEVTGDLVLLAANRQNAGWFSVESIEKFPCWDLETMDRLWQEYSNEHFGFSVQFPVFLSMGNKPGVINPEAYNNFGDRLGWRKGREWKREQDLTYDLSAPRGHLPNPYYTSYTIYGGRLEYTYFTQRAIECELPGFD